ncbi:MAG: hypothetical protein K0S92_45, partial [Desertimonas sp.]|nr:hypothetical protein [Desertimonas sp.]
MPAPELSNSAAGDRLGLNVGAVP